jgi:hypothetical protein
MDDLENLDNSSDSPNLTDYAKVGASLLGTVTQLVNPNKPPTAKTTPAASQSGIAKYLPWIGGAFALLVVLALVLKRK